MVQAPQTCSQDQWSNGSGNPPVQGGRRADAARLDNRLRRLAFGMSVAGTSLLSAAGVAVSQAPVSVPDARMQAPIGHRQPRPSDLPPSVQRDEQLNPSSAETQPAEPQPQNQTTNRGARVANVPTIDVQKGCAAAEKDMVSIFGPLSGPTIGTCLKQEQDARQEIIKSWAKYPASDKQTCINTTNYLPSYVEWLTCLEMYREVKTIESEPQAQATSGVGRRGSRRR